MSCELEVKEFLSQNDIQKNGLMVDSDLPFVGSVDSESKTSNISNKMHDLYDSNHGIISFGRYLRLPTIDLICNQCESRWKKRAQKQFTNSVTPLGISLSSD